MDISTHRYTLAYIMAKERFTVTIEKAVIADLKKYMEIHKRNKSNAVELLLIEGLKNGKPKKKK